MHRYRSVTILMSLVLLVSSGVAVHSEEGASVSGIALMPDGKTPWVEAEIELREILVRPQDTDVRTFSRPAMIPNTRTTRTGTSGLFSFEGVKPGGYWLWAQDSSGGMVHMRLSVEPGQSRHDLTLIMPSHTAEVTVLPFQGGQPVAGAKLVLPRTEGGESGFERAVEGSVTGANGSFTLRGLEEGKYRIEAHVSRQDSNRYDRSPAMRFEIRAGADAPRLTLMLAPFTIGGMVLHPNGQPAADALVVLMPTVEKVMGHWEIGPVLTASPEGDPLAQVTRTDAQGKYAFPHVGPGRYGMAWLYARSKEGEVRAQRIGIGDEPPEPYTLLLTRTAIGGTVLQSDGRTPIANVFIAIDTVEGTPYAKCWGPFAVKTDAYGRFLVPGMGSGSYDMRVLLSGDAQIVNQVTVEPEKVTKVSLVRPNGTIEGTVVSPSGQPEPGVSVAASLGGPKTKTDLQGKFVLRNLAPGDYNVLISGGNPLVIRNVAVAVRQDRPTPPLRVVLATPTVTLSFLSPDWKPLLDGPLSYSQDSPSGSGYQGGGSSSDLSNVTVEVHDAAPVGYLFSVRDMGYAHLQFTDVDKLLARQTPMQVRLHRYASISGRILEEGTLRPVGGIVVSQYGVKEKTNDGNALPTKFVMELNTTGFSGFGVSAVSSDIDGSFELKNLLPGPYEITFGRDRKLIKRFEVRDEEAVSDLQILLPAMADIYSISGRVLRPDGTPLVNTEAVVTLRHKVSPGEESPYKGAPSIQRRVRTDGAGRFILSPVIPSTYTVKASAQGFGASEEITVEVKNGPVEGTDLVLQAE